ncbi:hypothetical protein D3C78_906780 [compost metagenome]
MGQLVGAAVELGEGQALLAMHQGDGVRTQARLFGDQLMHRRVAVRRERRGVPALQLGAVLGAEHVQIADAGLGGIADTRQQLLEVPAQADDLRRAETVAVVVDVDMRALAGDHRQAQRIVGLVAQLDAAEVHPARLLLAQHGVHRIVLEHQDAVEQVAAGMAGMPLRLEQRRVLVLAQLQVVRLQRFQPLVDGLLRLRRLHQRQGVDEQAEHALDARHLGRTAGNGDAEGHSLLAGVALQQERPGRLDQGVHRDPLAPRGAVQHGGIQLHGLDQHLIRQALAAFRGGSVERPDHQRRLLETGQVALPELGAARLVAALQPLDVIAVMPGGRRRSI